MSNFYSSQLENDYDNMSQPAFKKMKYEPEPIKFSKAYMSVEGNIILLNTLETDKYYRKYIPVLQFQSVEGADIYLIANIDNIDNVYTDLIDINKTYTLDEIYNYFINNKFHIGSMQYYNDDYSNGIISNINTLNNESNNEIKLHYTKTRLNSDNVAWRTITWDLFENFVPQIVIKKLII